MTTDVEKQAKLARKQEKKLKKQQKKLKAQQDKENEPVADENESQQAPQLTKKELKKLKKQEAKAKAVKETHEPMDTTSDDTASEDQKKSKKHKKDKKKRQRHETEAPPAELKEAEDDDSSIKKHQKKKHKHDKHAEATQKTAPGAFSSGDGPYQQPPASDGSFKKAFYVESAVTAKMTDEEVAKFHTDNEMCITGNNCMYRPLRTFEEVPFPAKLMKCCSNFQAPTQIQSQCWPILASGRDIIGIAETGSGKTLAFALPGLIHIQDQPKLSRNKSGPRMLVVAPTRELAMQSASVFQDVGHLCQIKSTCIYGGVPKPTQKKILRDGVHVVVATPGRLKDLMEDGACDLANVTFVVLDEADRMLDDGFEKDIRRIIGATHPERQIAMFSATWPQSIQALAHEFLNDPVKVTIGSDDLAASHNVTQIVEVVDDRARDLRIHTLLQQYHKSHKNLVLIFVLYKKEADRVERMLKGRQWNCIAIHGDRNQHQRTEAVEKFKSGEIPLLIATDVAARGLDIRGVEYVINYSFPLTIEDYVHRIGRTGRGGNKGIAHTFFTSNDKPRAGELVNLLRDSNQTIPEALLKFGTHVKKKEHKLYGAFAKNIDPSKKATKITFGDDDDDE